MGGNAQGKSVTAVRARQRLVSPTGKPVKLAALHPNAALGVEYQKRLDRLIDTMHASVRYWLMAAYKANEPEISQLAQDKSPAAALNEAMRKLALRWNREFKQASTELGLYLGQQVRHRTDAQLKAILKRGGFSVDFKWTDAANDAYQAVVAENVGLIRSIAQEHLAQVQGLVMRSVQKGRDVGGLAKELEARYEITKRRAKLIAHDQNAKASAVIGRVRMNECGITTALWVHSGAGREPRPKHVAANGQEYDINVGLPIGDKGENVLPGEAISCRCVARAVIPALR
jgi:uncharacterized protein with gpF-like domain